MTALAGLGEVGVYFSKKNFFKFLYVFKMPFEFKIPRSKCLGTESQIGIKH